MTTPASVTRGEEFSISWMIENLGDEAVSTWGYIDGVFLSPTSTFNSLTAERLTSYEVHAAEAPAPGESRTYTQDVSLGGGPAGTFYFAVVADEYGYVSESNEDNNVEVITLAPVTVSNPDVDMTITGATVPDTGEITGMAEFGVSIANSGAEAVAGEFPVNIYLSTDQTYEPWDWDTETGDQFLGSFYHGSDGPGVPSGGTLDLTEQIQLGMAHEAPDPGDYYVIYEVNPENSNPYPETDYTNNLYVHPDQITMVNPDVDLQIELTGTYPNTLIAGQELALNWTTTNHGTSDAAGDWWDDTAYLSTDTVIDDDDVQLHYEIRRIWDDGPLAAGASYDVTANVPIPSMPNGDYYLIVETDSGYNQQLETDDTNNTDMTGPISIAAPDLVPISVGMPSVVRQGHSITIPYTVRNDGIAEAPGSWYDGLYMADDVDFTTGSRYLSSYHHSSADGPIAPGETYEAVLSTSFSQEGNFHLRLNIDSGQAQGESDDGNNRYQMPFEVISPDLRVTDFTRPGSATPGSSIEISWTVINDTAVPIADTWADRVYISTDQTLSTYYDTQLVAMGVNTNADPLEQGESYTKTTTVTIPSNYTGDYYLILSAAHSTSDVYEADKTNNQVVELLSLGAVDLTVSAATAPSTATAGETIGVSWTVAASGETAAGSNWYEIGRAHV